MINGEDKEKRQERPTKPEEGDREGEKMAKSTKDDTGKLLENKFFFFPRVASVCRRLDAA